MDVLVHRVEGSLFLSLSHSPSLDALLNELSPHLFSLPSFSLIHGKSGLRVSAQSFSAAVQQHDSTDFPLEFTLRPGLLGGKGGFGSMLRAQGGRMASKKTTNKDSCRDLQGRRLKTLNDAKKLAEYIDSEPKRKQMQQEKIFKKIQEGLKEPESKVPRFDDREFLNFGEEELGAVKDAVQKGLMKQKQKQLNTTTVSTPKSAPTTSTSSKNLSLWDADSSSDDDDDS